MNAAVLHLEAAPVSTPAVRKSRKPSRKPAAVVKVRKLAVRERTIGGACFVLAAAVLTVSLPHLAAGMTSTVGAGPWAAWAMALLFDLSQVAAESFLLARPAADRKERWAAKSVVVACTAVSVAYNGLAFLSAASGAFGMTLAVVLAALLPVGVLVLSYLGSRAVFARR